MQFVMGQQQLECLVGKISVEYLDHIDGKYPSAGTCDLNMLLPTKHETMDAFSKNMDKAFEFAVADSGVVKSVMRLTCKIHR